MDSLSTFDAHIILFHMVQQDDGSWLDTPVGDNRIESQQICGPSMGDVYWYNEIGEMHRIDGPAHESWNGVVYWYINDAEYDFNEWMTLVPISDEVKMLLRLRYA